MEDLKKERFELIERCDIRYGKGINTTPSSVQKGVLSYVVDCENTILAVYQGRFPKKFYFFSGFFVTHYL